MTAADNTALLERFYRGLQANDADAMNACYAPDVRFSDPAFGPLEGDRARAMWSMLMGRAKDLRVTYEIGEVGDTTGAGSWVANYTFSTGRHVENRISSKFTFRDGLIATHDDSFDIWRWASQALGPQGMLLGWSPVVKSAIRKQALRGLEESLAKPA